MPHYGGLFFREDTHRLELRSKPGDEEAIENEKTKKIIDLKGNYSLLLVIKSIVLSSMSAFAWDEFPEIENKLLCQESIKL